MRRVIFILILALPVALRAQDLQLPLKDGSLRMAVIGDCGTGARPQYEVGAMLGSFHGKFPFTLVLMLGDNLYGGAKPRDFENKFERPYKMLLDAGVKFYAALGTHDDPRERSYKAFHMNGATFYTFRPSESVEVFALDSGHMDRNQLEWLEQALKNSVGNWKICFFHHPLYSSGRTHGSSVRLRERLEPLFVKYGVSVVFSGHDHIYERIKPQKGIYYFVSGAAGKLRRGDIASTDLTAKGFDRDNHFLLLEIAGNAMYFQAVSRAGVTVDSGVIVRPGASPAHPPGRGPAPARSSILVNFSSPLLYPPSLKAAARPGSGAGCRPEAPGGGARGGR